MENRIEINGVWYIKEDSIENTLNNIEEELDLTFNLECMYENSQYAFVASRLHEDGFESDFYDGISIEFTDKRSKDRTDWVEEHWDNDMFFIGILERDKGSIETLRNEIGMCENGIKTLIQFLTQLKGIGWIS